MAAESWDGVLDDLESSIRTQRTALAAGQPLVAFAPPSGLPAMPATAADRARALLAELAALEADVAEQCAQLGTQLQRLVRARRQPAAAPGVPQYVDRRG